MKKTLAIIALAACTLSANAQGFKQLHSPEITADSLIFTVIAPNAQNVRIQGDWMQGWGGEAMTKGADGKWYYRTAKPSPEIYMYNVSIDGQSSIDPTNFRIFRDGQSVKSLLYIQGDKEPYVAYDDRSSTQKGQIVKRWYNSTAHGYARRLTVYLPYGYDQGKQKYPVLYLQHGGGGDEDCWTVMGRVAQIMDYLIEKGKAKPMIIVMPNGMPIHEASADVMMPEQWVEDMASSDFMDGTNHVKSLYADIIPFIEKNYRVVAKKSHRAVAGLSMGGIYTEQITKQHPEMFDYIGVLSMGLTPQMAPEEFLGPVKNAGYKLYWIGCGKTDMAYSNAERSMKALDQMGMKYEYFGELGGHSWDTWRKCLFEFAPKLFK
ncbi:MAG: esterase [Bacteroidales bacterium]|nr:esterase [Bacteroidales bacterium]